MYYEIANTSTRILGSIHLYPRDGAPPPSRIEAAYQWAKKLCIEHNGADFPPLMRLPVGQDLEQLIPPRTWQYLIDLMPPGADLTALRALKLWGAFLSLARNALDGVDGVEALLQQQASAATLMALETAIEVAALFDLMPLDSVVGALDYYGGDRETARRNFQRMHDAWISGDPATLWAVQKDGPLNRDPELYELVFAVRNRRWAERIATIAPSEQENTLVIVGAGHLVGTDNLLDLLRARGHSITPIRG
ncbi:TraB/GumN family protein [Variovorax paradoxus]|uniref:GumN family protein n=1 Tax=Variovorax paradoxus (strain EPS) TaxID=595537 RepID=E6V3U5_VARPE|nr:TraB/GumN family protein [Variovorax paradoxus]ADU36969.1 GumN family protein [Variovorax paradoxus EPS]